MISIHCNTYCDRHTPPLCEDCPADAHLKEWQADQQFQYIENDLKTEYKAIIETIDTAPTVLTTLTECIKDMHTAHMINDSVSHTAAYNEAIELINKLKNTVQGEP